MTNEAYDDSVAGKMVQELEEQKREITRLHLVEDDFVDEIDRLKRDRGALLHRLKHETSELRMCLGLAPNIEMALSRIQNIEDALRG